MEPDVNFILMLLGAKEVENAQLRQQVMALTQKLKELQLVEKPTTKGNENE